jgi:argonaute family protein
MTKLKINAYKIKDENIPQVACKYELSSGPAADLSYKYGGVSEGNIFYTLIEFDTPELKLLEKISLYSLSGKTQEILIHNYLNKKLFLKNSLKSALRKVRPTEKINNYFIDSYPESEVKKIEGGFYLIIDFHHKVYMNNDLWSHCNKDKENLEKYTGSKICFLLNRTKSYEIAEILEPDQAVIDSIINYSIEQKYIQSKESLENRLGKIDYNQPLIMCKNFSRPFIPQLSSLTFRQDEIEETVDAKKLNAYWKLTNSQKEKIISGCAREMVSKKLIETEPKEIIFSRFNSPDLLVKAKNGSTIELKFNSKLLSWLENDLNDQTDIYLPFDIPAPVSGIKIPVYILIEEGIKDYSEEKLLSLLNKYKKIRHYATGLPEFQDISKDNVFILSKKSISATINTIKDKFKETGEITGFTIIINKSSEFNHDLYEEIKRRLFNSKILSQNIIWRNLKNDKGYLAHNLLLQMMTKLGIKYFALKTKMDYDYILGLNTGASDYNRLRSGNCTVIFDSEGKISRIQPVMALAGETINLKLVLQYLLKETDLVLKGKKILLIRDGKNRSWEEEDLIKLCNDNKLDLTIINIKKSNKFKVFNDFESRLGAILDDTGLLLPHRTRSNFGETKFGSNPLQLDSKINFYSGICRHLPLELKDLELLYNLTRLNYSTLYSDIRLPAPVHYADKYVRAFNKGWEMDADFLKAGMLYFV